MKNVNSNEQGLEDDWKSPDDETLLNKSALIRESRE